MLEKILWRKFILFKNFANQVSRTADNMSFQLGYKIESRFADCLHKMKIFSESNI